MKMKQNDYVNAILTQLAESYRRSRKDDGTNVINRRTALKPEKLYRAYRQNAIRWRSKRSTKRPDDALRPGSSIMRCRVTAMRSIRCIW